MPHPRPPPRRRPPVSIEGPDPSHEKSGAHVVADHADLRDALARRVGGDVRFDRGTRLAYSTDASNYRQVPIGVVAPRDSADVLATLEACRQVGAPVLPRGAGTSLAGQACNVAVVLDFTRYMHQVLAIDPEARTARVQPGVVLDTLQDQARPHGLRFGPDPATHQWCTLGGMIGNNAAGAHSLRDGTTVRHVRSLTVATYRGQTIGLAPEAWGGLPTGGLRAELDSLRADAGVRIAQGFAQIPRRVSGYNLDELVGDEPNLARALVGTEGTCAVFLEACVDLVPAIGARALVVLPYPNIVAAARDVPRLLEFGPIALEGIERRLLSAAGPAAGALLEQDAPAGNARGAYLIAEFEGASTSEAEAGARAAAAASYGGRVLVDRRSQAAVWAAREAALGSSSRALGGRTLAPGWEDSSVHPDRLGDYLRSLQQLLAEHELSASLYGHFGEGCVHGRISFDFETDDGVAVFRHFMEEAALIVTEHNGSLSGEHGDGQARGELLAVQFGPELMEDFRRFKRIWDPDNGLNPGKGVDARPLDEDLRFRPQPTPHHGHSGLGVLTAGHHIAQACVGAGRCLSTHTGVMCPSYRASHKETETTRGRARLLFELATGDPEAGDLEAVGDALLTCLGCKACKTECPAGVDMAEAKSLFNAQRHAGRPRPRVAVISSFAPWILRAPSPLLRLAAKSLEHPRLGALAGRVAGFAPGTLPPRLAREPFTDWLTRQPGTVRRDRAKGYLVAGAPSGGTDAAVDGSGRPDGAVVLLWPDTFHNHFAPEALKAATRLLWAAGATVVVPAQPVCCGRTLVDGGFRDQAFGTLADAVLVMDNAPATWTAESHRSGTGQTEVEGARGTKPVVILEPSCLAMFRDELRRRQRAGSYGEPGHFSTISVGPPATQPMSLAEALEALPAAGDGLQASKKLGRVLLHGHCHQTALWGLDAEERVLAAAGYEVVLAPAGCCGMAGAFGLDSRTAALGRAVGELALLPAVRSHDGPVVANGFSCREQVRRQAGVPAVHLAEALWQSRWTDTGR